MKIQKIDFRIETAGQSITEEIDLDENFTKLKGIAVGYAVADDGSRAEPAGTVESLSVEGKDGYYPKGFETVNFFATTNCPPDMRKRSLDLPISGGKVIATLKENNPDLSVPYTIKMHLYLE